MKKNSVKVIKNTNSYTLLRTYYALYINYYANSYYDPQTLALQSVLPCVPDKMGQAGRGLRLHITAGN